MSTGDAPFAQAAGFASSSPSGGSGSSGGGFDRAASLVAGTAGELAKGAGSKMTGKFQDKVDQTAGGRLASSIRESMEPKGDNDAGADSASPSFDSDSLSGGNGGGWVNQSGGFDALSSEDQETARQISPVAEAVANMFTILYYQAETGRATPEDFQDALATIRQATRN